MKDITKGEILRFGIVGCTAVAIQYGVYLLMIHAAHSSVAVANTVAYVVSFCFNFMASTRYTFRVKANARRAVGFAGCHMVNYLLQLLTLHLFIGMGIDRSLAPIPMFAICVPVNFVLVRTVLKRHDK